MYFWYCYSSHYTCICTILTSLIFTVYLWLIVLSIYSLQYAELVQNKIVFVNKIFYKIFSGCLYYNTEDTSLYISEYSLLAFGDKHLLHMLIYWDFTTLTVYQAKSKLNKINLYCMLGYIRIYSGYKSMQKNSHCVFWYFKTFIAYWDLSVLFVYICIKTSNVYCHLGCFRTYSVCIVLYRDVSVLY